MTEPAIRVEGLRELRSSLRAIDRKLPAQLNRAQRDALKPIAAEAAALAPHASGRLAASIRPFVTARTAGIRSRLVYANVQHWGGTTGRGHSRSRPGATRVKGTKFAIRALERNFPKVVNDLGDAIVAVARAGGWH